MNFLEWPKYLKRHYVHYIQCVDTKMSDASSVNGNVSSRVRKVVRDDTDITSGGRQFHPWGQQPKMLGCWQWSGELEADRGSRCRKSEVLVPNLHWTDILFFCRYIFVVRQMIRVEHFSATQHCDVVCRVKFDAYRQCVTSMKMAQTSGRSAPSAVKIREVESALQMHRHRYARLQNDLAIKLKFLEENKVKL